MAAAAATMVNAMAGPRIQHTTAVANAHKAYAITLAGVEVARANASATLQIANVAAADAATYVGINPRPRSTWWSVGWSFITTAALAIAFVVVAVVAIKIIAAITGISVCVLGVVAGLAGLAFLAKNAYSAVMNRLG
ncbi:MAG: hypothetical protein ACK53L_06385, partial [Pirellulaceae bacterium]